MNVFRNFINSNFVRGPDVNDISIEVKGYSLSDAIAEIKKAPAKFQPYSLIMVNNLKIFL